MQLKQFPPSLFLRIGLGLVLLWFGISETFDPKTWSSYVPLLVQSLLPITVTTFVMVHGIIEVIFGSLLLIGFAQRIVSVLVSLHLLSILIGVGYNEIGVRDFGLVMAAIALALSEPDAYTLDAWRSRRNL